MNKSIPDELYQKIIHHIPIASADVVVLQANMALLLRRTIEPLKGYWALPGGRILLNELPKSAASRRLEAETGLRIPPEELIGEKVVIYLHPGRHNVAITYLAKYDGTGITLDGGHDKYIWTPLRELPEPIWDTTVEQITWAVERRLV